MPEQSTVTGVRFEPRPDSGKRVWVTRTAPHNRLTAQRLRAAGFDPLIEPALHIKATPSAVPLAVPDALVFTSLQGVRLHRFFPSLASLPVFAVGDHTARFAKLSGYRNVASSAGDVHDLRALIRDTMPPGSDILHMSAAQPAGDLQEMLREDGFTGRRLCVYEAVEASLVDLEWVAGELGEIGAILVHSPRSGRHIADWLSGQTSVWKGMVACISAAAALPFRETPGAETIIAARPNEDALFEALKRLSR